VHAVVLSLAGRELEREMIPLLKDQGLGFARLEPARGGFLFWKIYAGQRATSRAPAKFDFRRSTKRRGLPFSMC